MENFREWMSDWKAGDFFRQLATVVIGIIITFGGSSLIQKSVQKKEARHILEMVRDELKINIDRTEKNKQRLEHEYNGARALRPYMDNPGAVPLDSLLKYRNITNLFGLSTLSNSFQILRGSSAIQAIRDKEFLRNIFSVYESLGAASIDVLSYIRERKSNIIDNYFDSIGRDEIVAMYESINPTRVFSDMVGNVQMAKYLVMTANGDWITGLIAREDALLEELRATVEMIDKEIN